MTLNLKQFRKLSLVALAFALNAGASTGPEALSFTPSPLLFGPEFTFYCPDHPGNPREALKSRMEAHLVAGQPTGEKFLKLGDKFESPHGWHFTVSADPGVLEITTKPMTVQDFKKFKDDIQDAIFASAANEGCFPALYMGGGHLNIGTRALSSNRLLLRNFIVDLFNHSELFMGILSYDTNNALPYALFPESVKNQIAVMLGEFDSGRGEAFTLMEDLKRIQVSIQDPFLAAWRSNLGTRNKHTAVSFDSIGSAWSDTSRIEIRGVRPQASMEIWVKQIELMEKRLEFLSRLSYPIPLSPQIVVAEPLEYTFEKHVLNPPVNSQEALAAFHRYVSESGLSWQDHREYVWPAWLASGEVERYEHSPIFNEVEQRYCESSLSN